eukprot:scaffold277714_cov30-Tisochrysis_lutea.AAC.1
MSAARTSGSGAGDTLRRRWNRPACWTKEAAGRAPTCHYRLASLRSRAHSSVRLVRRGPVPRKAAVRAGRTARQFAPVRASVCAAAAPPVQRDLTCASGAAARDRPAAAALAVVVGGRQGRMWPCVCLWRPVRTKCGRRSGWRAPRGRGVERGGVQEGRGRAERHQAAAGAPALCV